MLLSIASQARADCGIDTSGGIGSGGKLSDGGCVRLDGTGSQAAYTSKTMWTFRTLSDPNRAIQFPDYFIAVHNSKKRLQASLVQGDRVRPDKLKQTGDEHEWYKAFIERLVNDFEPKVRGAIGANVRIKPGGVKDIAFYGYRMDLPFERAVPTADPANTSEDELKKSVVTVLNSVEKIPEFALPSGVESIEIKVILGGEPDAESGCWTSTALIDDLNGNISFPK